VNDVSVPSYRVRPADDGPSWRMLALAGGFLGVIAVGGAAWWGASRIGGPRTVPVIEPDPRPVKVRPEDPGGLRVANQDEFIFDRDARDRVRPNGTARLAPEPERPALAQLRAQVAPPPVVMEPVPAAPAPAPDAAPGPAAEPGAVPDPGAVARQAAPPASGGAAAPSAPSSAATSPPAEAPAEAPTQAAAGPAPVPNGRVRVQLGALLSEEQARGEWDRLARRMPDLLGAFRPQILRFERGEGTPTMWRLRTGGFASTDSARDFCEQVRARGGVCAVIGG
jgi:hypothetical protein